MKMNVQTGKLRSVAGIAALTMTLTLAGWAANAADHHIGYYYPDPGKPEVYHARSVTLPESDRAKRLAFVTALTDELLSKPYPPEYVIFAKGDHAEKMIIVGVYDNAYNTMFRMRALLAELTSVARMSKAFQDYGVQNIFTFFDLLNLLGFKQLTVTDGKTFAHQVVFK